jgi:hypothetical protein
MKEYRPDFLKSLPRWFFAFIQFIIFLFALFVVDLLKLDSYLFNTPIVLDVWWILFFSILFWTYKLLGTFTAIDNVIIDFENGVVTIKYWKYYIFRRILEIKFSELSYKNKYNTLLYFGGSLAILIYKNTKLKIKLNRSNGWKDKQVDEIIKDLLLIKPSIRPLVKRPF